MAWPGHRGLFLMEAMWMRTNPAIRRIARTGRRRRHRRGDATSTPTSAWPDRSRPGTGCGTPELGGGALLDLGVYPVTFAHLFLGPPASVTAWARLLPEGTDENTGIVLGYAGGAVATLHCGLRGETGRRATITGTDGPHRTAPRLLPPGPVHPGPRR